MSIALCINGRNDSGFPSAFLDESGTCALGCIREYASSLPGISDIYYLTSDSSVPEGYPWSPVSCSGMRDFLKFAAALPDDVTEIVFVHNDTPLVNVSITLEMLADHKKYHAEFTFAEGFPLGFAPEILSREGVTHLANILGDADMPLAKGALFDAVAKDINAFDLETKISKKDMRSYRVALGMDTKQQFLATRNIYRACTEGGRKVDEDVLTEVITVREELQRTLPVYVSVQITDGCPQKCGYCPYPKMNPELLTARNTMKFDDYQQILGKLKDFMDTSYINISPFGEPSLHPDIYRIIQSTADNGFTAVVETSGLGWDREKVKSLTDACKGNLLWIVSIDSNDPKLYSTLRGEGFSEAFEFAKFITEAAPETGYVQCVRMKENEDLLEPFYRFWKERTDNIIIQKYDWYSGFLPENTVSDISPIHRNVCWHLKRDLTILLDGTVPLCKADVKRTRVLGNIFTDAVEKIWQNALPVFREHADKKYEGICEGCDEYYTYNF